MAPQQRVDVLVEPARVAELEAVTAGRKLVQRRAQALQVASEVPGQLPQDRPQLAGVDQRLDPLVEALHALLEVGEAFDVRQVAARLYREQEVGRSLRRPVRDGVTRRQPIEGRVDLDRVEEGGVVLEPPPRRHACRIHPLTPVAVVPARAADPHGPLLTLCCHTVCRHRGHGTRPDMPPPAALLDVDGTLVDTNYHHALAWYRAFRRHDIVLPLWRIHRHMGMGGDQLIASLLREGRRRAAGGRHPGGGEGPLHGADRRGRRRWPMPAG